MTKDMQHIAAASLSSLPERIDYLRKFIEFTADDAATLHSAAPVIAPLVPTVVDVVYVKLLSFDITAQSFVPRNSGYSGDVPVSAADLTGDHPQIRFRKDFLKGYLAKLVSMDYADIKSWEYLDRVGLMHTGEAGKGAFRHRRTKPALRVELIHCTVLLGYVEDILVNAVMTHPDLDIDTKNAVLRAVNKLLWIQQDLFQRHYLKEEEQGLAKWFSCDRLVTAAATVGVLAAVAWAQGRSLW